MPMTDFSTGFQLDIRFLCASIDNPEAGQISLSRRVASQCNLFASKSALALHTDVRADYRYATRTARNEFTCSIHGCRCTYVANQDDDTSINHLRQRPGVQHCSDKIYAARCGDTVRRNTVLGQYQVDTSIANPAEMFANNGIIRTECFAREAHYTGHSPSASSISMGSICH